VKPLRIEIDTKLLSPKQPHISLYPGTWILGITVPCIIDGWYLMGRGLGFGDLGFVNSDNFSPI
jgi:hypothetical protein